MAVLSLTDAQRGFQGSLSPGQASYSGSLGGSGYQGNAQGGYQGPQSGYQGYLGAQGGYDQGSQGNYYANQRY